MATDRPAPGALTQRISTRQLAEAGYRALRVGGVPSGVATDAARDAVEIEREHGRGLEVLHEILSWIAPSRAIAVDVEATHIDAGGASALLLASPLVALAGERAPSMLVLRRLWHAAALEPALLRHAHADGLSFVLSTGEGVDVLRVRPGHSASGDAWATSWVTGYNVRLYARKAQTCASAGADRHPAPRPGAEARAPMCGGADASGLVVDGHRWRHLSERAARYLV